VGDPLPKRAAEALAKLVAAGRLRSAWVPGMLDTGCDRVLAVDPRDGLRVRYTADAWFSLHGGVYEPDLDDPLTVQGLVLLAREAWGVPLVVRWVGVFADGSREWAISDLPSNETRYGHHSEAEAAVAALEAAAEVWHPPCPRCGALDCLTDHFANDLIGTFREAK
jgi:hypothetical protein